MPDSEKAPPAIKFPVRPASGPAPTLSLRRRPAGATRSPFAVSEVTAAARESIKGLVTTARPPGGMSTAAQSAQLVELEKTLRQLELTLAERERIVMENEARQADRERDLAEME